VFEKRPASDRENKFFGGNLEDLRKLLLELDNETEAVLERRAAYVRESVFLHPERMAVAMSILVVFLTGMAFWMIIDPSMLGVSFWTIVPLSALGLMAQFYSLHQVGHARKRYYDAHPDEQFFLDRAND
jgi:hypothetical protein